MVSKNELAGEQIVVFDMFAKINSSTKNPPKLFVRPDDLFVSSVNSAILHDILGQNGNSHQKASKLNDR